MIYESLLLFGVLFAAAMLFDVITNSRHALKLRYAREAWLFIVLGAYFVFFWRRGGQTLAMKTWRIKLTDNERAALPLPKAIVRYVLSWLWVLPGLAIAYELGLTGWSAVMLVFTGMILWASTSLLDRNGQFLHDRLAKTQLIDVNPPPKEPD